MMKNTCSTDGCGCETEFSLVAFASGQLWLKSPFSLPEQMSSCSLRLPQATQEMVRETELGPAFLCYSTLYSLPVAVRNGWSILNNFFFNKIKFSIGKDGAFPLHFDSKVRNIESKNTIGYKQKLPQILLNIFTVLCFVFDFWKYRHCGVKLCFYFWVHSIPFFVNCLAAAIKTGKITGISPTRAAIFKQFSAFLKLLLHLWPSGGMLLSPDLFRVLLNPTLSVECVSPRELHCWGGRDLSEDFIAKYARQGVSLSSGKLLRGDKAEHIE